MMFLARYAVGSVSILMLYAAVSLCAADRTDDDAPSVRRAAARALGGIGDARAIEPLIRAVGDPDHIVCKEANASLIQLTGHKVHVELGWPAEIIHEHRLPVWEQWWQKHGKR